MEKSNKKIKTMEKFFIYDGHLYVKYVSEIVNHY